MPTPLPGQAARRAGGASRDCSSVMAESGIGTIRIPSPHRGGSRGPVRLPAIGQPSGLPALPDQGPLLRAPPRGGRHPGDWHAAFTAAGSLSPGSAPGLAMRIGRLLTLDAPGLSGGIRLRPLTDTPRATSLGRSIGACLPREVWQETFVGVRQRFREPHQVGGGPTLSLSATRARLGAQPSQEVTRSPCAAMGLLHLGLVGIAGLHRNVQPICT